MLAGCIFTRPNQHSNLSKNYIWDILRDLVTFVQFKKPEKHPWWSDIFRKFIKSTTPPWVFFTFFKLNKWNQIAQSINILAWKVNVDEVKEKWKRQMKRKIIAADINLNVVNRSSNDLFIAIAHHVNQRNSSKLWNSMKFLATKVATRGVL